MTADPRVPSETLRVLHPDDPFCPKCGHNRDTSSVSSIDCGDDVHQCQMCETRWRDLRAQLVPAEPVVWRYKFRDRAALDAFLASENCAKPMAEHDRLAQCVDRFLNWPLPKTFSPDCGISFSRTLIGPDKVPGSWPVGTNLFTADEARQMLEHVLAAAPESEEGKHA